MNHLFFFLYCMYSSNRSGISKVRTGGAGSRYRDFFGTSLDPAMRQCHGTLGLFVSWQGHHEHIFHHRNQPQFIFPHNDIRDRFHSSNKSNGGKRWWNVRCIAANGSKPWMVDSFRRGIWEFLNPLPTIDIVFKGNSWWGNFECVNTSRAPASGSSDKKRRVPWWWSVRPALSPGICNADNIVSGPRLSSLMVRFRATLSSSCAYF